MPSRKRLTSHRFKESATLKAARRGERLLERGDKGAAVALLREALVVQGLMMPAFDADTDAAVRSFQKAQGIGRVNGRRINRTLRGQIIGQASCHRWRDRPGSIRGPAFSTWFQIRRPTASASAMMLSSSIVRTLWSRMMNWPSTMTDSMSDG